MFWTIIIKGDGFSLLFVGYRLYFIEFVDSNLAKGQEFGFAVYLNPYHCEEVLVPCFFFINIFTLTVTCIQYINRLQDHSNDLATPW